MRIILVGYGEMISSLLLGCLENRHQVVGILRHEQINDSAIKRFFKDTFCPNELVALIRKYKIHQISAPSINSKKFFKKALNLNPDIILVGSWSEILTSKIINLPTIATINCHPSLLPKYRGPNPYYETIRHGETQSGITFHLMSEKLDQGPILLQKTVNISSNDTGGSLRTKCAYEARKALKDLLLGLEEGTTIPIQQNETHASYFKRADFLDCIINFENSSEEIYNQIRAFNPWQRCFFLHNNYFLTTNSAQIGNKTDKPPGYIITKSNYDITVSAGNFSSIILKNVRIYKSPSKFIDKYYINNCIKINDFMQTPTPQI